MPLSCSRHVNIAPPAKTSTCSATCIADTLDSGTNTMQVATISIAASIGVSMRPNVAVTADRSAGAAPGRAIDLPGP